MRTWSARLGGSRFLDLVVILRFAGHGKGEGLKIEISKDRLRSLEMKEDRILYCGGLGQRLLKNATEGLPKRRPTTKDKCFKISME